MSDADKKLEAEFKRFLELDQKRKNDPTWGQRNAENCLMALCEHMKKHRSEIDPKLFDRTVAKMIEMNLVRYRSYCREHLLDVGVTNV